MATEGSTLRRLLAFECGPTSSILAAVVVGCCLLAPAGASASSRAPLEQPPPELIEHFHSHRIQRDIVPGADYHIGTDERFSAYSLLALLMEDRSEIVRDHAEWARIWSGWAYIGLYFGLASAAFTVTDVISWGSGEDTMLPVWVSTVMTGAAFGTLALANWRFSVNVERAIQGHNESVPVVGATALMHF